MSYSINRTDGSILTEITDGSIDQIATDLTLIGKSASAYGEYINENLVHLLENFANTSQPKHPIQGQLWYDTVEGRLKVYDNQTGFKLTGGTLVSKIIPSSIAQGDIWIDTTRNQLYFNNGESTILAGPMDPTVTGTSILAVRDQLGSTHNVLILMVDTQVFGIVSTAAFIPDPDILGYTAAVKVGLNLVNTSSITNVADPVAAHDAVNKISMTNAIKLATLSISVDISNMTGDKNQTIIDQYLNKIFPVADYSVANVVGPKCRVICTDNGSTEQPVTIRQFVLDGTWQYNIEL